MQYRLDNLRRIALLMLLLLGSWSHSAMAQTCKDNILASTPTTDFRLLDNGSVEHQLTGLVWSRCAWGQQWDGQSCQGTASERSWIDMLHIAQTANVQQYLGSTDWRVPNIKELQSIVETRCYNPAINAEVFPDTAAVSFWSASVASHSSDVVWFIRFSNGDNGYFDNGQNSVYAIRLVRGGQLLDSFVADTMPDAFNFAQQSNRDLNTRITSNIISIKGINTAVSVRIQNGEYRINEGDWGSAKQTLNEGDKLQVRHTSASTHSTQTISTVTVGEQNVEFISRTMTEPVVELPELDYGYIEGSVSDACTGQPLAFVNVQFGNVNTQQSDKNGEYSIRLQNGDYTIAVDYAGYSGDSRQLKVNSNTRYEPFALAPPRGCHAAGAESYKAVIVAAGGEYIEKTFNPIWSSTQLLVDRAYRALKLQGFGDKHIYYLSADTTPRDADGDGKNDIDAEATLDELEYALTEWAGNVEDVVVYLIGHGGQQVIQLGRYSPLPATQLNRWLDDLQTQIPGKLSVVLDACYSGSFIAPLAAKNRYVMTSTRQDLLAVIANRGTTSFSYHFWDEVIFTGQLGLAFRRAEQAMSRQIVGNAPQAALLDTNGDRTRTEADYEEISEYCFGACNSKASIAPEIESVGLIERLRGELSALLSLTTPASFPIVKGWATIQRPDYNFPTDNSAINSLPRLDLDCQANSCRGVYRNFNLNGEYLLTFSVENQQGQVSLPRTIKILQTGRDDREYSASSIYEPSTGLLTLKDVEAGGQHYYAELQDEGGYTFALKYVQPLSGATQSRISQFDGQRVTIPSVFAYGGYYAIELLPAKGLFQLDLDSVRGGRE